MQLTNTQKAPLLQNQAFGMIVFIITEIMLFSGFISAFVIVKAGIAMWPPLNQPRLPVESTAFNTFILLLSGVVLFLSGKFSDTPKIKKRLLIAICLGLFFVGFQGFEWVRLLSFGLTMTSSVYGSFFYLIIGVHAIHAFSAMLYLIIIYLRLKKGTLKEGSFLAGKYLWYFVVGVWPVLYYLVYLQN